MSGGLRNSFGPLALCVILSALPGQSAFAADSTGGEQQRVLSLEFPLIALEPKVSGRDVADNGDVIFSQPLRPAAAIQTKADFQFRFAGFKGSVDIAIPAGSIFVKAISSNREFYCTSRVVIPESFWGRQEVGLCFQDITNDGSFDEMNIIIQNGRRIRSPYELSFLEPRASVAVTVAYERMPEEKIPSLDLRGVFYNDGNFWNLGVGTVSLGLCWPVELTIPATSDQHRFNCALPDWESNKRPRQDIDAQTGRHSISLREGTKDKITWGPISINYTAQDKNRIAAQTEVSMPLGPLVVHAKSVFTIGLDIVNEVYVLDVKPVADEKVATPKGGI